LEKNEMVKTTENFKATVARDIQDLFSGFEASWASYILLK
jgi:hypothetical protein